MKKISLLLLSFVVALSGAVAQEAGTAAPMLNFDALKKRLDKSNAEIQDPAKNILAKTWVARAELLFDVNDVNIQHLRYGMQPVELKLLMNNPKQEKASAFEKDGRAVQQVIYVYDRVDVIFEDGKAVNWIEKEVIIENPLQLALEALKEAEKLDTEGKMKKKIKKNYETLKSKADNKGLVAFTNKEYGKAYEAFKVNVEAGKSPLFEGVVDTAGIFNAGLAAHNNNMFSDAIGYYEEAKANNYGGANTYIFLKTCYVETNDSTKALETLQAGIAKFPSDANILIELINFYLTSGRDTEALDYIDVAIKSDPSNKSLYFAKGTLLDKLKRTEDAVVAYNKAIELDTKYFDAYYNLGVVFYNQAVELFKQADAIPANKPKEYEAKKAEAENSLKQALPYMEKASEINPSEKSTLETLKSLYLRLRMMDKFNEMKTKLESM